MSENNNQENVGDAPRAGANGNQLWNQVVPDILAQHLLRTQWFINRLAVEQDLRLDDLGAEVESLHADIDGFHAGIDGLRAEIHQISLRMDGHDRRGEDALGRGPGLIVFVPQFDLFPVTLIILCSVCVAYLAWVVGRWLQ
ncbi:hypothetical protein FGRMN_5677 [Fusarium graminum]|nr:hypothetical protein FGRMN_5677 [Fusarium graminum]